MKKTHLSIIILSYNTSSILKSCLDSLYKYTKGVNFEIIVIDHNSKDGSVKMLKDYSKRKDNLLLIEKKDNPGFGTGNNNATKLAKGEYFVFLNSDVLLEYNLLHNVQEKLNKIDNLGIYSIKLLNKDKSFQASGGSFPTLTNLFLWQLGIDDLPLIGSHLPSFHPKEGGMVYLNGPEWVTGAFMVVPRKVFQKVGGFDEKIFMYTEEMELAYRISKLNKKTIYDPSETIIHLGGTSSGSYLALTSEVKNIIYFWRKHKPKWQVPIVKVLLFIGSLLRLLFFGIIKQNETSRKAYIEALRLCF